MFKNKEKKAIQAQIDSLDAESNKIRAKMEEQRKEVDEEFLPQRTRKKEIDDRLNKIKEELRKDR